MNMNKKRKKTLITIVSIFVPVILIIGLVVNFCYFNYINIYRKFLQPISLTYWKKILKKLLTT